MTHTQNKIPPIGAEQVRALTKILQQYKHGKSATEQRIISSESWWKMRNDTEGAKETDVLRGGFVARSGWLHNVIVNKHADAMEAYPEPVILPREEDDRAEADMLSAIIPCVLEQNRFEEVYSEAAWRKMKSGTAVYKVFWDKEKLGGLGDVGMECVSVLNLYWEPGVKDIQKSGYFFQTELWDKDVLRERYPFLQGSPLEDPFTSAGFLLDDRVDTSSKATVVEAYYHKNVDGRNTLQYVRYVGDTVLFATENETEFSIDERGELKMPLSQTGLYDHGRYPYIFDALYPIEGSPCGYGYVDICRNPQTEIDMLKTCFVRNARVGSIPRYFSRGDGTVNEEEFLDLDRPIVHTVGSIDENALRPIAHKSLDGAYMSLLQWDVNELRETSGNTETAAGNVTSGVTAASAIAALQEASGKLSRDSTMATYRAYADIVDLCIELIRQFYRLPRKFRILGRHGAERYVSYKSDGILPRHQGTEFGQDMGMRLPVFDVRVFARKKNAYSRTVQNELALQLFELGFFDPGKAQQALLSLSIMDFEGKDEVIRMLSASQGEDPGEKVSAGSRHASLSRDESRGISEARRQALLRALPAGDCSPIQSFTVTETT